MAGKAFPHGWGTDYRVLVVDDHPAVRKALLQLIPMGSGSLKACSILEAGSEEEAVVAVSAFGPHVVPLDRYSRGS